MNDEMDEFTDPAVQTTIDQAADALRQRAGEHWVEVSDRVLQAALRAPRRARPVRAKAPGGSLQVSENVLIAYLRSALDGAVPGTAVQQISIILEGRDELDAVIVQLVVRYRTSILNAAKQVRTISQAVLDEILSPAVGTVKIRVTHVHVDDIITSDPDLI